MYRATLLRLVKNAAGVPASALHRAAAAPPQHAAGHKPSSNPASSSSGSGGIAAARASPLTPPVGNATAAGAPKKKIVKKIIKKIRPAAPPAAAASTAVPPSDPKPQAAAARSAVNEGEALRRELRGIPDVEPADGAQEQQQPAAKTPMVKAYKIDEVTSLCGPHDAIFARRLPAGGCQFFAWPGTPLQVASSAIVSMPDTIRTVHAVFGRYKTPVDIVMDVDCPVPQEYWSMTKILPYQRKVLDDVMTVLMEEIKNIGEKVETQVVLQSPNLKKASFHIHTKLKDVAFEDVHSLHGFLAKFHARMPTVDLQIYRTNGMLRMFSCMKENRTSAMTVFDDPKWNIGFRKGKVSDAAAALHSVCVREEGTYSRLLKFDPPRATYTAPAGGNNRSDGESANDEDAFRAVRVLLPRTEREAVENASRWLRNCNEIEVGEWRSWIGLGICAFRVAMQFKDAKTLSRPAMEEMLEAWVIASRHCPHKFKVGDCEQRWATFDATKLNTSSDWWTAYQRLGRLENAVQESIAQGTLERFPLRTDNKDGGQK